MAETKWAADERKLQSAYDDLSDGRVKAARSTVDRHLKKNPKSQPALILRMALLGRTGAGEEAVLKALDGLGPVLTRKGAWWVGFTLRSIQRLDLALEMYETYWNTQPDQPELGEQVFLHAASAWDTNVMTTCSRKMFNTLKTPVWGRVAAWSEWVSKSPQPTPEVQFTVTAPEGSLKVATLLLSTTGKSNPTSDLFWLRLQILISANQLGEALRVAQDEGGDGSLARMWFRMEGVKIILETMQGGSEEGWEVEWNWIVSKLKEDKECQRNYAFYRHLLFALEHSSRADHTDETIQLLSNLHDRIGSKERAPLLARLELAAAVKPSGSSLSADDAAWVKLVDGYWSRWGSKGCVVTELEGVAAKDEARREVLIKKMEECSRVAHSDLQAYREVVNAELLLLRHRPRTWRPDTDDVKRVWALYSSGLVYGRNLPKTDIQHADDVGLAAVHLLLIQWHDDKSQLPLFRAFACLRYIISKSPNAAHAKYLLTRLARMLGVSHLIPDGMFGSTAFAEVQFDTLTHVLVERGAGEVYTKAMQPDWSTMIEKAESMYKRTAIDIPQQVKLALQEEAYSKIPGMRVLASTMANSLVAATMRVERARLSFLRGTCPDDQDVKRLERSVELARKGLLVDSRDWSLMLDIGGNRQSLKELTSMGEITPKWCQSWGGVILAVCQFVNGGQVMLDRLETKGVDSAEKATLDIVVAVLRRVSTLYSASNSEGDGDQVPSLTRLLDVAVQQTNKHENPSRWSSLYPTFLHLELLRILEVISKRLEELAKPSGAGKKKSKPDPRILAIGAEHRTLRDDLRERLKARASELESLHAEDADIDWANVLKDLCEDKMDFVGQLREDFTDARGVTITNLVMLLNGKKL